MSNVEHLFENALALFESKPLASFEEWVNIEEKRGNTDGVSKETLEALWEAAIYTKYTYIPALGEESLEENKDTIINHTNIPDKELGVCESLYGFVDEYGEWQDGYDFVRLIPLDGVEIHIHRALVSGYPPLTIYRREKCFHVFTDGNEYFHNIDNEEAFLSNYIRPYLW